jgi:HEPN domain-containing protein
MLKFDIEKTIEYWLNGAKYDLDVAKALYEKAKYPYALFMGHLAIEKLLKALVVKNIRKHAPYTHTLSVLADKLGFKVPQKIQKSLIRFMEFHFEARYPEEQKKFYKKCTKQFAGRKMKEIKEVFTWLKKKL